jgi:hypothetical protein
VIRPAGAIRGASARHVVSMIDTIDAQTPVEYICWQGCSSIHEPALVVSYSAGNYHIRLLKVRGTDTRSHSSDLASFACSWQAGAPLQDGSTASCSGDSLRLAPLREEAELDTVDAGDPVDVFEPSTSRWRAMVAMHAAVLPLGGDQALLLLQPGKLLMQPRQSHVCRSGYAEPP